MAWFVVQKDGERAQVVAGGELMGAVNRARAEVRVAGVATYTAAQLAIDAADTKFGIRLCKADVKRASSALEVAAQAHQAAPTKQTLDAVKAASAAHKAECAKLRMLGRMLRVVQHELQHELQLALE